MFVRLNVQNEIHFIPSITRKNADRFRKVTVENTGKRLISITY